MLTYYPMITYAAAIRLLKKTLEPVLPGWRGRMGVGGNVFHTRPTKNGLLLLSHSVLNYKPRFEASCWLSLFDERLGLETAIALSAASPLWRDCFKTKWDVVLACSIEGEIFRPADGYQHKTDADVKAWCEQVAAWIAPLQERLLRRYQTDADTARELRGGFLVDPDETWEWSGWRRWELMLLAAKLAGADWYEAAGSKLVQIARQRDGDPSNFEAILCHIDQTPALDLGNLDSVRSRFAQMLLH